MRHLPKYRRDLMAKDFQVTSNERATHMHILERAMPVKKGLTELLDQLSRHDALDPAEAAQIEETIQLIDGLLYPMSLLNEVEDPREVAIRSMFARSLRARSKPEEIEAEDDETPSFRP